MSATFYNPDESGHGIMIDLIDDELVWMCWFAFDLDGNPAWICSIGMYSGDTIVFDDVITVEGGAFPPLFDAEKIVHIPWGTITIVFTSCNVGTMQWTTDAEGFQSGSMPLHRLTTLWGVDCEEPDPDTGDTLSIPRSVVPVTVNGLVGAGEWDDAVEVPIVINPGWTVPVRLKSDGMNLFALFSNVSGPNNENRVAAATDSTTFPELFIDLTPNDTESFDSSNRWFHMSFQDCHKVGKFADPTGCNFSLAGWEANNWPLGVNSDFIEVRIGYDRISLDPDQSHTIRLFATMTSSLLGDVVYYNWPAGSHPGQPSTWHLAEIQ